MDQDRSTIILVVDDDEEIVDFLASAVSLMGDYKVLTAMSGQEALDVIERELPDLVLLDIMMGDMDGTEVCRAIRANERTADILVIAITAIKKAEERYADIMDSGVDDYMEKPLDLAELKEIIEWHLKLLMYDKAKEEPDDDT